MRNRHYRIWIMTKKMKMVENETQILFDLEKDEKH